MQLPGSHCRRAGVGVLVVKHHRTCCCLVQRNAAAAQYRVDRAALHLETAGAGQGARATDQTTVVQRHCAHGVRVAAQCQFGGRAIDGHRAAGNGVIRAVLQFACGHCRVTGVSVLLIECDRAISRFIQHRRACEEDIHRTVLHFKTSRTVQSRGSCPRQTTTVVKCDGADRIAMAGTQVENGCWAVHREVAAVSQKTGGRLAQRAAVDNGAAGVGIAFVKNQNTRVSRIADSERTIGKHPSERGTIRNSAIARRQAISIRGHQNLAIAAIQVHVIGKDNLISRRVRSKNQRVAIGNKPALSPCKLTVTTQRHRQWANRGISRRSKATRAFPVHTRRACADKALESVRADGKGTTDATI